MPEQSLSKESGHSRTSISLVFAYYDNPEMLALQWSVISEYPLDVKARIEVIIVDDSSPQFPAGEVHRPGSLPAVKVFRILQDVRWNQDAARNIGAFESGGFWLLLTDIDHVVPAQTLRHLLAMEKDPTAFYSFARKKFGGTELRDPHPNSYFMSKDLYWTIGGHDEDYAGIYGKDFLFRKRALRISREIALDGVFLDRVGSKIISDAGTRTLTRDNTISQRVWGYLLQGLKAARLWRGVQTMTEEYRRVV
jgi:hypothetical protein